MKHVPGPSNRDKAKKVLLAARQITAARAARALDADVVRGQIAVCNSWFDLLKRGERAWEAWQSLADAANISETLAEMGIGCGADDTRAIVEAHEALAALHIRHSERGTWTMRATEIAAIAKLIDIHEAQLQNCTYLWFEQAYEKTRRRIAQAIKGNGPKGSKFLAGQVGVKDGVTA